MFTSGSDILVCWPLGGRGHGWRGWGRRPGASCGGAGGAVAVVVIGWRAGARGVLRRLWRGRGGGGGGGRGGCGGRGGGPRGAGGGAGPAAGPEAVAWRG